MKWLGASDHEKSLGYTFGVCVQVCICTYVGLAKWFIQVFLWDVTEKSKWTFWPTQYVCISLHDHLSLGFGGKVSYSLFKVSSFGGMIMIHCLIHETVIKYFSFLLKNGSFPANGCRWDPLFLLVSALRSPGKALCGVTFRPSDTIKGISLDFPGGPVAENPPASAGDTDPIPGLGRVHMPHTN